MDSERIEAIAADWFAKQQSGQWTSADQAEFDLWLAAATAHRVAFIRLDAAWRSASRLQVLGAGVPEGVIPERRSWGYSLLRRKQAAAADVASDAISRAGWRSSKSLRAIAACAVVAIGVTIGVQSWRPSAEEHQTAVGGMDTVPLADGSRITLSTDSRVRVMLSANERRIELEKGEAFFDVAKDKSRPFVVVAGDRRVIAVGTQFSVRRNDEDVRVVVTEGRVRFANDQDPPAAVPLQLDAGAIARATAGSVMVREQAVKEAEQLLSWRNGFLMFRDTALTEAVAEFNRYNQRKIVIADDAIADIRIGGSFRVDNIDAFLWLLENGFPVRARHQQDAVVLSAR
ncbi:FecR family protein [Steroidobacter sp.]|uniref:FecR family protein n=1 Tax=Steroidobacter sp. TaxID=1978227 RepID=UPI001A369929|nr:FecR domain-containing protein [Steroidobacter sp.]MBL8271772.1 FecR domain-containing protein [Steroidobacter sp.]